MLGRFIGSVGFGLPALATLCVAGSAFAQSPSENPGAPPPPPAPDGAPAPVPPAYGAPAPMPPPYVVSTPAPRAYPAPYGAPPPPPPYGPPPGYAGETYGPLPPTPSSGPVYYYAQPPVYRVLRYRPEWAAQVRVEAVGLGRDAPRDSGMGGVGLSLRPRPTPHF
ncbi:MAG TPA: hypothetical protein VGL13_15615, partial [Polyangiaceae bacterium]